MLFSSVTFLFAFLPIVLVGTFLLPRRARLPFLFAVSLVFYGWGEPVAVLLMVFSIAVSYAAGRLMAAMPDRKRGVLAATVAIHLALLGFFKYAGFFMRIVSTAIPPLRQVSVPDITLPIGISFYTFQSIAYCIDAYRGDVAAEKSLLPFGTYITFFPQLIAGPIERYGDIRPQLTNISGFNMDNMAQGARLFVIGLSKKLLLANPMGQMWDALKLSPSQNGGLGCWAAVAAFTFHIYFDFSGYSDMACGLARMLGIGLRRNFNYPYAALSVTDFWRRWHITLSDWFRAYVYIPLGGNRKGRGRQALNLLIVWLLTGLWHGANFNFVLWGLYYAVLLIAEKLLPQRLLESIPRALRRCLTLLLVMVGWAIFACDDLGALPALLGGLFAPQTLWSATARAWILSCLPMMAVCAAASVPLAAPLRRLFARAGVAQTVGLCLLLALCAASLAAKGYNPFLYFRF